MRILIAEDDSSLASFVKKGLDAEHYAVDVSNDGEQARAMAGEFDYDLVVLDLNLPRLDGVAILRYLRTRKPSMPILVLTGVRASKTGCSVWILGRTIIWANLFRSRSCRRGFGRSCGGAICRRNRC
jgi:DNA-binding response OmpR family regulator